jgi:excisionase family DNA binding protein
MSGGNSNERLLKFLQATPEQQIAIDRILDGQVDGARKPNGPLLVSMGKAAKCLGVSRPTLWRLIKAGKLTKVEILPGCFRVRRTDLEAVAAPNLEHPEKADRVTNNKTKKTQ